MKWPVIVVGLQNTWSKVAAKCQDLLPAQIKLMDYITWPPVTHSKSKCKSNFSQGVANFSFNWAETFQIQMLQQIKQKQQPVYFYWFCWWENDISIEQGRFLFTNEMEMLFEKIHLA